MSVLPEKIVRLDDGMLFLLNKETDKYRIHLGIPHLDDPKHLHNEYSYDNLMGFFMNNPQKFKVVDGTEDIEAMVKNWKKKCESHNDGHGNGEDDCDCGKGRE